ncbi:hypothetical protein POM88_047891 [Heracleum sosnowskyi]|uniref:PB1-like domain-containing protein n=1 Tax=Heracleum sosnowskyi TaxID=360622 RepID=A0AAD8GSV8_9APIA|nr:hypothetical protein POM88_047891 [Heracleum sosnowskyi]
MNNSLMEYQTLSELQLTGKHDWKIKVRLTRKWKQTSIDGNISGVHMILIDQSLVAEEIYEICNFNVAPYTEKYKCFECDLQIVLTNTTIVTALEQNYSLIPDNVFKFTNLKHFKDATEQDNHLIDIVGVIDDVRPVKYVTNIKNGDQFFREFVITDLIHTVKVVFWNELATAFDIAFNQTIDQPIIIIIESCKMIRNQYNGDTAITNMPATTFDLNANCEKVETLRNRSAYFTIKLHFRGKFVDDYSEYVGGQVAYFDMCSVFKLKLVEIEAMLGQVQCNTRTMDIWLLSNEVEMFHDNLIPIETEKDLGIIIDMVDCNYKFIWLYMTSNSPTFDDEAWDFSFTQMAIDDRIQRIEDIRDEVEGNVKEVVEEDTEDEEEKQSFHGDSSNMDYSESDCPKPKK